MALLYETSPFGKYRLRHQYARRDDGQWFGRLIPSEKTPPWVQDQPPARWIKLRNPISSDDIPNRFAVKPYGVHRLVVDTQPELPAD